MAIITKNFVSTRISSCNNLKNLNNILHNLRCKMDGTYKKYKSNDIDAKKDINNYLYLNGNTYMENKDILKCYTEIKEIRDNLIKEHKELYKKYKKESLRDNRVSSIAEGILTFSNTINQRLTQDTNNFNNNKINEIDFYNTGIKAIQDIARENNLEILYISYHRDETTPHFHYHFKNYDNNGNSIMYKLKRKEMLSNLQDIAAKPFKKYNMTRGIKKDYTHNNYVKVKKFHSMEQQNLQIQLNKIKDDIELERKELELLRKEIINNTELDNQRKKDLYNEIALAKKELDNIKDNIKSYKKNDKEINIQIKKDVDNIIQKSKNIISYDIKIIKNEISNLLKVNYNIMANMENLIDIKTIQNKDDEISNLKLERDNLKNTIKNNETMENLYIKQINKKDEIIKNNEINNIKNIKEINNLKIEISNLEIEINNLKIKEIKEIKEINYINHH